MSCLVSFFHPVLYCTVVICIRKVKLSSKLHTLVRFRDRTPMLFSPMVMSKKRNIEKYFRIVSNLFKTFDKNRPFRKGNLSDSVFSIEMSYSVDWFMIPTGGPNSFESMKTSIEIKENSYYHLFAYESITSLLDGKNLPPDYFFHFDSQKHFVIGMLVRVLIVEYHMPVYCYLPTTNLMNFIW